MLSLLSSPSLVAAPPNILFILVDDLAWTDLACYGHPWHETPAIDSLATAGMRFTQAYSPAPICSAARASLLTGKTPARLGLEFVVKGTPGRQVILPPQPLRAPPYTLALDLGETTMAEALKRAGYKTAYFGKWHLNPHYQGRYLGWDPFLGPSAQGFSIAEEDFGSHPYSQQSLPERSEPGRYQADGLTERAVGFLEQNQTFFLMVSHFFVHTPVRTPYLWLKEKYQSKIPREAPQREKRIEYAAFVETLDHHVGQLLDALDASGRGQDTLVVFLSDNGGHPEYVSHAPLRGSKWNLYEGGIRVPMIARWPKRIAGGTVCETPVIGYDLFPIFLEIAGADPGGSQQDGMSLLPLFDNPDLDAERTFYWHFPYYHPEGEKFGSSQPSIGIDDFVVSQTRPHSAIRKGDYKLISFQEDDRKELYHLSQDPSERINLHSSRPEHAARLADRLQEYLNRVNARQAESPPVQP